MINIRWFRSIKRTWKMRIQCAAAATAVCRWPSPPPPNRGGSERIGRAPFRLMHSAAAEAAVETAVEAAPEATHTSQPLSQAHQRKKHTGFLYPDYRRGRFAASAARAAVCGPTEASSSRFSLPARASGRAVGRRTRQRITQSPEFQVGIESPLTPALLLLPNTTTTTTTT